MKPSSPVAERQPAALDLPESFAPYLAEERYDAHLDSSHDVWREVLRRNAELIREHSSRMHPGYVAGRRSLALTGRIPRVEELNQSLSRTGWRIVPVDGYIPTAIYAGLMARNIFPVSRVIRRPEHVDFAPAPDMVHDILGHLPLLFSEEYRRYLQRLASVMTRAVPNELDQEFYEAVRDMADLKSDPETPGAALALAEARMTRVNLELVCQASEVTHLRRIYVWSIEFGLLGTPDDFSVHGAALLSSPTEFRRVCASQAKFLPYSRSVAREENSFSELLAHYFVAQGFSQYLEVLAEFAAGMLSRAEEKTRA